MSDIKLDYTGQAGDLDLTGHRLNLSSGEQAIEQQLRLKMQFFLGEWFLDQRLGIPYYRDILVKNPNMQLIRSTFRAAILDTPGIASVETLDLAITTSTRTLTLSFNATMDTGEALVFEPFIIQL